MSDSDYMKQLKAEETAAIEEAREVGKRHGYDHANYEAAYGPEPKGKPGEPGPCARTMPLRFKILPYGQGGTKHAGTQGAYTAGWRSGVARYKREHRDGS